MTWMLMPQKDRGCTNCTTSSLCSRLRRLAGAGLSSERAPCAKPGGRCCCGWLDSSACSFSLSERSDSVHRPVESAA